jgi:hypothetical protein
MPGYWMYETSGRLRPAVEAYLFQQPLSPDDIAALRAYLRQWIDDPALDENPFADTEEHAWLSRMRARIDDLTSRQAISDWLADAVDGGLDPL